METGFLRGKGLPWGNNISTVYCRCINNLLQLRKFQVVIRLLGALLGKRYVYGPSQVKYQIAMLFQY